MRLPARVSYGFDRDQGPTPDAALSEPADQADGADEEPCLRPADGDRGQLQQAAAAQGRLLRRTDVDERRGEREHTAAAEAEQGDDLPLAEARLCPGQFAPARSASEGAVAAASDRARGGADHGPDVGPGDGGGHTFPFDQASDQLPRAVRG